MVEYPVYIGLENARMLIRAKEAHRSLAFRDFSACFILDCIVEIDQETFPDSGALDWHKHQVRHTYITVQYILLV